MVSAKAKSAGVVLHRGVSPFDGTSYVVIASFGDSSNTKTGNMIQVYILADGGMAPHVAVKTGNDVGICGDCPLKGVMWKGRACYVNVATGPNSVWECYMCGGYDEYDPAIHDEYFAGRDIRWGTYGEPVLIPVGIVKRLCRIANGWTGYTHQWRKRQYQKYRRYFMASTHTIADCERAVSKGWRFFKSANTHTAEDIAALKRLTPCFNCPASKEQGHRMQCWQCLACSGSDRQANDAMQASVWIDTHGGLGVMHTSKHIAVLQ